MPRIAYVPKFFPRAHLRVITQANAILAGYAEQGILITLRSLYYQFVARDLFPDSRKWVRTKEGWRPSRRGTKNAEPNYKWLGGICGDVRLAGMMDWDHLEDRVRSLSVLERFAGPQEALDKLASWYHVDMWSTQAYRPEVWIEKDALAGMVQRVCEENDVPYFCCRGYTSLSEMWRASMRLRRHLAAGQRPYIIHFGDHDPSGVDMSRDIAERMRETFQADCAFVRVALTMDQVREYEPPPNPAKVTDSRCKKYVAAYGDESWELDALEPTLFRELILAQIEPLKDQAKWGEAAAEKAAVKAQLKELAGDWSGYFFQKARLAKLEKDYVKLKASHAKLSRKKGGR